VVPLASPDGRSHASVGVSGLDVVRDSEGRFAVLEDNVRIYHFVNGKRMQFKGVNIKVAPEQWHTLRVEFSGGASKVFFDGKHLFDAEDATLKDAGAVGVWTKADSVTLFDDFDYGAK
jgi:hypothetical protein